MGAMKEQKPSPPNALVAVSPRTDVAMGAAIAQAIVGATRIMGFLMIFGNCTFGVHTNCAKNPPKSFSRKDTNEKATYILVVPINIAALDTGSKFKAIAIAAEEAGDINTSPPTTAMTAEPIIG